MQAEKQTLAGTVATQILHRIDQEGLKPGDLLPSEAQLGASLGVSRVVVREAVKVLEGQGVVEPRSGRGTSIRAADGVPLKGYFDHVIRTNSAGIVELMEVRAGLETFGCRLAARRRTNSEAREITRLAQEMRLHLDNLEAFADLDVAFHLAIANSARNSLLTSLMTSIRASMRGAILAGLQKREGTNEIIHVQELHERIANAIAAGNVDAAAEAMANHFSEAVEALVE